MSPGKPIRSPFSTHLHQFYENFFNFCIQLFFNYLWWSIALLVVHLYFNFLAPSSLESVGDYWFFVLLMDLCWLREAFPASGIVVILDSTFPSSHPLTENDSQNQHKSINRVENCFNNSISPRAPAFHRRTLPRTLRDHYQVCGTKIQAFQTFQKY